MRTKYIKTAMNYVITHIRMDMVMHTAFIKASTGGFYCLWVTPAGNHNDIKWVIDKFVEGSNVVKNEIILPREVTHYT